MQKRKVQNIMVRASDVLEMREREGSDALGAREDRGKGGEDASKHSAEVDASQDEEVSQYSEESRRRSEALTGALGRRLVLAEFNCMRGWPPRSSARERSDGTREVLPRTTTTPVVLKASGDHAVVQSRRREDRTAFSERQC